MANKLARMLRKQMTPQEVKLWVKLRELSALGFRFRRQVPIGPYITDFLCFHSHLIVEADGGQHNRMPLQAADATRDAFFAEQGFIVLRFWNHEIDRNMKGVLEKILVSVTPPTPHASGRPSGLPPRATLPTRGRD